MAPNGWPEISSAADNGNAVGSLYADLSVYYDSFCAHVDYAGQCAFADRAFAALADAQGKSLLDLACGTGQHLSIMSELGYTVSGLDNSPAMLAAARQRCPSARLILQDIASFEFTSSFDLITCFLYSIHYSFPVASLATTLARAWEALKPGGLLLFDLADKAGVAQRDAVSQARLDGADFEFRSGWRYCGDGEALDLLVSIRRLADGQGGTEAQYWTDRHTMTAISIAEVVAIMQRLGFDVQVFEHDFTALRAWARESFNVIIVGVRP
ncbi:MAG: SAM-dependent methyltransferase [unclassified Hahellaceae]|nr:SAM-dependent methyltransferase [Hahellaceae bacterium]